MKVEIEKNIPIAGNTTTQREWLPVFEAMEIGDSFLCSPEERRSLQQMVPRVNSRLGLGIKIAGRKQPDGQFRVWLIAKAEAS